MLSTSSTDGKNFLGVMECLEFLHTKRSQETEKAEEKAEGIKILRLNRND